MKRGTPLSRRTPLRAKHPLVRKTPLTVKSKGAPRDDRAATALSRPKLAARVRPAVPPARRKTLAERSGGVCEIQLPGCVVQAHQASHRITQKAGGRHGAAKERHDRLSNVMHACWLCHHIVTAPPRGLDVYEQGWCLREWQVPALVPVLYRGEMSYLGDGGEVVSFEAVGT